MFHIKRKKKGVLHVLSNAHDIGPKFFFLIIINSLLAAASPFVNLFSFQIIIDGFVIGNATIVKLALIAFVTIFINVLFLVIKSILMKRIFEKKESFKLKFEKAISFHQMNFHYKDIESTSIKEFQLKIDQTKMRNGGIENIIEVYEIIIGNICNLAVAVYSFFYVLGLQKNIEQRSLWTGVQSILILLLVTGLLTVLTVKMQKKQNEKICNLNDQVNQSNGAAFLYMQLISDYRIGKDIRMYKLKDFLCNKFDQLWSSSIGYKLMKSLGREKAKVPCVVALYENIILLFIYYMAIMKAIDGEISIGSMVLYVSSIQIFTQTVMALVNSFGELNFFGELFSPYLSLLNFPKETVIDTDDKLPNVPFNISFENVSFKYPHTDKWAIKDVSFTISDSEKIAVVGENGSGKTTIIKLLCRLYEPQMGQIKLNGVNINEFGIYQYRNFLSVVFQDFSLPSFKLGENISCSEEYIQDSVESSIDSLGLSNLINCDLDTYIFNDFDQNGVEVSGGEAQKIAIARALYKDSPIIVLDEPTAALDPRAEAEIYTSFDNLITGKTAIYISHRLSSCRFCQKILVFDKGNLIQDGTHEKLVNQTGKYNELWQSQANFYI